MPKRILLADDSITIQKVVELTFSDGDYEVTAVNNGARAIQKLSEMRPDIILSDIIMPEKNGYEVCEYVKSHPEYRNIPVVLLTGTFEPFDPDRAEKAGCDAVVTKPFESQSLIHKVEELVAHARTGTAEPAAEPEQPAAAPTIVPAPAEAGPSPWLEESPAAQPELTPSPFTTSGGSFPTPDEAFTHDADIFGAPPESQPTTEMPFEAPPAPAFSGETNAFPRMTFDDFPQTPPPPPPAAEPSPWDEQALGGETRAFEKMSFGDLQAMQPQPAEEAPATEEAAASEPFGAPPPVEEFSGETRAFPRVDLSELQQMAAAPPEPSFPAVSEPEAAEPQPAAAAEPSPWDEPAAEEPIFGGDLQAHPEVSLSDFQTPPAPVHDFQAQPEPSPWDEQPGFAAETRAFEKMSFADLQGMAPSPEPEPLAAEPAPWEAPVEPVWEAPAEPAAEAPATMEAEAPAEPSWQAPAEPAWELPAEPAWPAAAEAAPSETPEPVETFATAAVPSLADMMPEELPFVAEPAAEPELEAAPPEAPVEPEWSAPAVAAAAIAEAEEAVVPPPALVPEAPPLAVRSADLTDAQIDKIARRVVELMSEQVVRNIAWEVIPDLAEMVVKERIRQLESEA